MKGGINVYRCHADHWTVTIDAVDGTTPFMIRCRREGCGLMAESGFYRPGFQSLIPTHEWYKADEREIARMEYADACREHADKGGLFLRPIAAKKKRRKKKGRK
jgi:hypothetical protein